MSKHDRQPRQLSIAEKLQVIEDKVVRGDLTPKKPIYLMLMESEWPTVSPIDLKGFDPLEVPEQPMSAGEAAVRQNVLKEWLHEGWPYKDFCKRFGGPTNVIQSETQIYP